MPDSSRFLRETVWRDLRAGDVFGVPGVRGRRFRFRALVTNLGNGDRFVEAMDVADGRYRSFRPELQVRKDRRASAEAARRRGHEASHPEGHEAPPRPAATAADPVRYEVLRLFD